MNVRGVRATKLGRRLLIAVLGASVIGVVPAATAAAVTAAPGVNSVPYTLLNGVSCVSASSCTAVGYYLSGHRVERTLVESWDGAAWSIVASPNNGPGLNYLTGVSCISAGICTAVGLYIGTRGITRNLIESWDGTAWSIVPSPDKGTQVNYLSGVSCVSATSCVAVGTYHDAAQVRRTLIELWDGTAWSIASSPNPGAARNFLDDVSCASVGSCVAVGSYLDNGRVRKTLIESWDGNAWSVVASPNPGAAGGNRLRGVTCVSATSCVAVGRYTDTGQVRRTLIESWDGASWSIVASPDDGANHNYLTGVSCVSSSSCIAVGQYVVSGVPYQTLIESWDGTAWSIVSSPNDGTGNNDLRDVSCVSVSSCQAVGWYDDGGSTGHVYEPLIESWDGASWSIAPGP